MPTLSATELGGDRLTENGHVQQIRANEVRFFRSYNQTKFFENYVIFVIIPTGACQPVALWPLC